MDTNDLLGRATAVLAERGEVTRADSGKTATFQSFTDTSERGRVELRVDPSWRRVVLEHRFVLGAEHRWSSQTPGGPTVVAPPELTRQVIEARPAHLDGACEETEDGLAVSLTFTVYDDGLTRHTLLGAPTELTRTRAIIERLLADSAAQVAGFAAFQASTDQLWDELDQAFAEPSPEAVAQPAGEPAREFTVSAATPVYDSSRAVIAELQSGPTYPVLDEAEGWVRTVSDDGHEGWVSTEQIDTERPV